MKKICVLGLGYIGMPTSAVLALNDYYVIGVDINKKIVETINDGKIHIKEPNLSELVKRVVIENRLIAKTTPEPADIFIICVPTPILDNKTCDLSYVTSAINSIVPFLKEGDTVIVESTVPPNTTENIIRPIIEEAGFIIGKDIFLAFCPERVLPGKILEELINNTRIIGGYTSDCTKKAAEIYSKFVKGEIILTNAKTAELTKLIENTFRDVNIALANELTKICIELKINVLDVIKYANKHPRVSIHNPGPGVGGHCLAVDPYFIIEKVPEIANIISLAREINNSMPYYVVSKIKELTANIKNPKITVFGAAYKGNTDDLRESPALKIISLLKQNGYSVSAYDHYVDDSIIETTSLEDAVINSDMILILADHDDFKTIDYNKIKGNMRTPIIFDTKNIIVPEDYIEYQIKVLNFGNVF